MTLSKRSVVAVVALALAIAIAGCGGGDESAATNLTGTWDMLDLSMGSVSPVELTHDAGGITGSAGGGFSIEGDVTGATVQMTFTIFTNVVYLTGTLSSDGGNIAGSYSAPPGDTGTFSMTRRGTGQGVDMTGQWLSQDLENSVSAPMAVTQSGSTLTGVVPGTPTVTLMGTISGPEVTFTHITTNRTIWTGYLSFDGNTVLGNWHVDGSIFEHGWRMVRQ